MTNPLSAATIDHNGQSPAHPVVEDAVTDTQEMPAGPASVQLEDGIPGLSDGTSWTLAPLDPGAVDGAFQLLSAHDDPDASLIVADPWTFFSDYAPDLPDNELEALGITQVGDAVIVCAVTLDAEQGCFYLNLLGPFVFHATSGVGRQIVLGDQDWPVRARVDVPTT